MKKYTEEQNKLWQNIVELEKEIWDAFSEKPRCPICNENWTDAHQEYLEWQWFKEELDASYQEAQKQWFKSIGVNRKIKTAQEYYDKQKDFEETVEYFRKNHINGF